MYPPDQPSPTVPEALPLAGEDDPAAERRVELATVRRRKGGRFVAPVPLAWFQRACRLPGKALAVALVVWHLARMRKTDTVRLTQAALNEFGVSRQAKYRGLRSLEAAGLVSVRRRAHRNPEVTVLGPAVGRKAT
jgi:hypothetical protein